ncbi:hypothetical protein AALD01_01945 [Oscillospiraceae bacterium 21-37]
MLVVNLFGAPGSGKSTGAAYVFSKLKLAGVNAELVTEFAKDKVWEDNRLALANQAYLFGEQYYRLTRLDGKVDVAVSDSPLLLSNFYVNDVVLGDEFEGLVKKVFLSFTSLNAMIKRVKEFDPVGRIHNEKQSDTLFTIMKNYLDHNGVEYNQYDGCVEGYDNLVLDVLKRIKCGA